MSFGEDRKIHAKHKFKVFSLRFGRAEFQKMSELQMETAKIEYYEGGALIPIKDAGRITYSDCTLERGSTADFDFFSWMRDVADASIGPGGAGLAHPFFKADDVAITQLDRDNTFIREWELVGAFPVTYNAGDWDNTVDEVVIENLTLTYDFFQSPGAP